MDELILDNERLKDIGEFMDIRNLSYNTWERYMYHLVKLSKKYGKIDKRISKEFLSKAKNTNQIAVISLINEYCIYNEIDFFIRKPKRRRYDPRKEPNTLTINEVRELISKMPYPENLMIKCLFNIGGGLRISDVLQINCEYIEFRKWLENKEKDGLVRLKNRKGNNEVVTNIPPSLMKELLDYVISNDAIDENFYGKNRLLFNINYDKFKPELSVSDPERWRFEYIKHGTAHLQYLIKKCGFKGVTTHTFRHSKATYLHRDLGYNIELVRKAMDHKNINTTLIYAKMNKGDIIKKMEGIETV